MGLNKKIARKIYNANRKTSKIAQTLTDIEDLSKGRPDKVIKRSIKRHTRKKANSFLNRLFKKIDL